MRDCKKWCNIIQKSIVPITDYSNEYLTFIALENGTFTFTPQNNNVISYSTDGTTWTDGNSVQVNSSDRVMWKGTMSPNNNGIGTFSATGNFDVQGNVMSLLYGDGFKGQTDLTGKNYAFYALFSLNKKVINTKNLSLPAITLAQKCYTYMFSGCTNLINTPQLPAITLIDACYAGMFNNCTSLVTAPELPAVNLATYCYNTMFFNCTSLKTAPLLPATILATYCYNSMFGGCTSLVIAPELPAITLAKECYGWMFRGCTSLNYIKAMFTTKPSTSYTENWVKDVAASGTFVKNSAATWNVSGVDGVPTGWTIEKTSE